MGTPAALTLLEMILAMAMMAIIFAVIVPQFRPMLSSWDSKAGAGEALQNGRVLIDHLKYNLSKAVKITDVSGSAVTEGYIEYEDNDGNTCRYDVASSYARFGVLGDLNDLAGPVSQLQFTCYDACDLDTPIPDVNDVNSIRSVKVQTTLTNSATLGQDKTFIAQAYLRTNGNPGSGGSAQTTYDYSNRTQGTDIFAYDGESNTKPPTSSTTPSDVFSAGEYDDIEYDDGTFHAYNATTQNQYAQMRFVIQIDESEGDVTQIDTTWNGKGVSGRAQSDDGASLYIWNYNLSAYELLEESADTEAEVTLTGTLNSSIAYYIGGAGEDTITLLANSNSKVARNETFELFTDYVKLEITATGGGGGQILP
jgi:type II secretory pathway pseudopilin PulG